MISSKSRTEDREASLTNKCHTKKIEHGSNYLHLLTRTNQKNISEQVAKFCPAWWLNFCTSWLAVYPINKKYKTLQGFTCISGGIGLDRHQQCHHVIPLSILGSKALGTHCWCQFWYTVETSTNTARMTLWKHRPVALQWLWPFCSGVWIVLNCVE